MTRDRTHEQVLSDTEELERLLERAERDPAASAELDFLADLCAAAELERPALEAALAAAPDRRERTQRRPRIWLAAAAVLLVASGLTLWFRAGRTEPVRARDLAERAAPRYFAVELRSPEVPGADALQLALEPYARGDYGAARATLEALLRASPDQPVARFYLAAAEEQLGELDSAEANYRNAATGADGYLAEHALWRLANLLLARDDVVHARAELEHLRDLNGAFGRNASELLERLAAL